MASSTLTDRAYTITSSTPKVALITGCSKGGIGYHLCEELASRGCTVYATARRPETLTGLTDLQTRGQIHAFSLDVTHEDDVERVVNEVIALEGKIDILVNNAGLICIGPLLDVNDTKVQHTFDTNVFGALRMARAVIPHMAKRKQGLVVNVGSIVGEIPTPWNGVYCASKAALHSITEVLQMECTPLGVSVMLLTPGSVRSNLAKNHESHFSLPDTSLFKEYLHQIIRRMHISQTSDSMDTRVFARCAVDQMMERSPRKYVQLGGNALLFSILRWIPRSLALWLVWKSFSKK